MREHPYTVRRADTRQTLAQDSWNYFLYTHIKVYKREFQEENFV